MSLNYERGAARHRSLAVPDDEHRRWQQASFPLSQLRQAPGQAVPSRLLPFDDGRTCSYPGSVAMSSRMAAPTEYTR